MHTESAIEGTGSGNRFEDISRVEDLDHSVKGIAFRVENGGSETERLTAALSNLAEIEMSISSLHNHNNHSVIIFLLGWLCLLIKTLLLRLEPNQVNFVP